jgi:molybdopterin-guanine dinucleotide biosynthesis protein A
MAVQIGSFILAGGVSSRMKRDKALLEVGGEPLLVRTARLLESVVGAPSVIGDPATYKSLALPVIADDWPGAGPLGGIATALRASTGSWNLVVACDLPYLTAEFLRFLLARAVASTADAVLPMNTRGAEPLCAMYHKRGEPAIRAALESGIRKVTDGLQNLRVETIPLAEWKAFDSEGLLFKNMNLPQDYQEAAARLGAPAEPGKK